MANQLRQQIDQISREKNINPEVDHRRHRGRDPHRVEEVLQERTKTCAAASTTRPARSRSSRCARSWRRSRRPRPQIGLEEARKLIPEAEVGQEIEFPKPTDILGRIAAQTAKQVIFQKVREAERDNVFAEYSGRVGEVVNGIIKRQEMGDFVVDLGRAEAVLPRKEQSRAETYQTGRPRARRHRQGAEVGQGPAGGGQPHRSGTAHQALRDGSARDLRRHRPDQGLRARGGRAGQGRGHLAARRTSTRSAPASA